MGLFFKEELPESQKRGNEGEEAVSDVLHPFFGRRAHKCIENLVLTDERGKTHQIDHVEIRENGIFCIETKNYSGMIFGSEEQTNWTQVLYKKKYQFLNPIKQNKSHIYHINRVLKGKYDVHPLIVFVQDNADKIDIPYVINLSGLKRYLKRFDDGFYYPPETRKAVYEALMAAHTSGVSTARHVQSIEETKKELEEGICPRCGGALVIKKGQYGDFLGCSHYPRCRFTQKASPKG